MDLLTPGNGTGKNVSIPLASSAEKSPFSEEEPTWVVLEYGSQKHHSGATEVPHALQTATEIDPFPMAL